MCECVYLLYIEYHFCVTSPLGGLDPKKISIRTLKGHSDEVNSVGITSDNEKVVSGSDDKTAKVWSMDDGNLLHTFQGVTVSTRSTSR